MGNLLTLPPPHYHLGDYCQWVLDREEFPLSGGWEHSFFPHIQWRARGEEVGEEHWGCLEEIPLSLKLQLLRDCPETVLFDWRAFENLEERKVKSEEWRPFFNFSFPLLPRMSLCGDRIVLRHYGSPLDSWPWWPAAGTSPGRFPQMVGERQIPCYQDWEGVFSTLKDELALGHLEKVVLSRKKVMLFSTPFPHHSFFCDLFPESEQTYHILLRPTAESCFCSLSPERLFRREGRQCYSEAIAGSRERGMEKNLLESAKDRHEHEIVLEGIEQDMETLALSCQRGETTVMDLGHVQHLKTPLAFTLGEGVEGQDILRALHPTAALGGRPKEEAMKFIRGHGAFERGLYGAPIGRWCREGEEYAVGIRSALAVGQELHLFAGAGVIPQSRVLDEWREAENKMGCFQ